MTNEMHRATRWIGNDQLRTWVENKLEDVPDYFWAVPASSTGKYHPDYSQGEGGLVRHTRVVVFFVLELAESWQLTEQELDIAIAAAILHDTWKLGKDGKHTAYEHPELAAEFAREDSEEGSIRWKVADLILTHMGPNGWGNYPPKTTLQWFLHTCDYFASRKLVEVKVDEIKC